jgi:hypothetical protein
MACRVWAALNATSQSKTPQALAYLRCETGGLGRNRTIDTRIFNAVLKLKVLLISKLFSVA